MSNPEWIEAGAVALLGTDRPCRRWGIKCVTHTTNYLSANFSNQSATECDRVHQARVQATLVLATVEPLIHDKVSGLVGYHSFAADGSLDGSDSVLRSDVLALFDGAGKS